jgi:hypothetical protein
MPYSGKESIVNHVLNRLTVGECRRCGKLSQGASPVGPTVQRGTSSSRILLLETFPVGETDESLSVVVT